MLSSLAHLLGGPVAWAPATPLPGVAGVARHCTVAMNTPWQAAYGGEPMFEPGPGPNGFDPKGFGPKPYAAPGAGSSFGEFLAHRDVGVPMPGMGMGAGLGTGAGMGPTTQGKAEYTYAEYLAQRGPKRPAMPEPQMPGAPMPVPPLGAQGPPMARRAPPPVYGDPNDPYSYGPVGDANAPAEYSSESYANRGAGRAVSMSPTPPMGTGRTRYSYAEYLAQRGPKRPAVPTPMPEPPRSAPGPIQGPPTTRGPAVQLEPPASAVPGVGQATAEPSPTPPMGAGRVDSFGAYLANRDVGAPTPGLGLGAGIGQSTSPGKQAYTYSEYLSQRGGKRAAMPAPMPEPPMPEPPMGAPAQPPMVRGPPPAYDPNGPFALNLVGKVALINSILGLESTPNIATAIEKAKESVGCDIDGNLSQQADALLHELMPM